MDKIIERIRKMLAIANDDAEGGEHERDAAMKMALKLLAKYNLDMAEVESSATKKESGEPTTSEREIYYDYVWVRTIAGAVSKLYFCHVFTTKSGKKDRSHFTFVGRTSNVATAKAMFEYLVKSVTREASRTTTEAGQGQTFKWSFCKGASAQIHLRCTELRKAAESEKTPGTALVLASVYEKELALNLDYIRNQLGITLGTRKTHTRNTDGGGYQAGKAYGAKVGLNNQIK